MSGTPVHSLRLGGAESHGHHEPGGDRVLLGPCPFLQCALRVPWLRGILCSRLSLEAVVWQSQEVGQEDRRSLCTEGRRMCSGPWEPREVSLVPARS